MRPLLRPRGPARPDVTACRVFTCEQEDDLGLDGIGVLEFVHEQPSVLPLKRPADLGVAAQHPSRELQQVAIVEGVAAPALARGVRARGREQRDAQPVDVLPPGRKEWLDDVGPKRRVQLRDRRGDFLLRRGVIGPATSA